MQKRQVRYSVMGLDDGTIWLALVERGPGRRSADMTKPDQDGICRWWIDDPKDPPREKGMARLKAAGIANCLNMKRVVREQVASRLDKIEGALAAMRQQLDRIEKALAARGDVPADALGSDRTRRRTRRE